MVIEIDINDIHILFTCMGVKMKLIDKRNRTIDILKGVSVLLVILGHSIQRSNLNYLDNTLFKLITAFNMPFFILLTGYVLGLNKRDLNFKWIVSKFNRLLIPLFAWSIIYFFLKDYSFTGLKPYIKFPDNLVQYIRVLLIHPDFTLWFLWVVFVYYLIYFIINRIAPYHQNLILILNIIILRILPASYLGINRIVFYYPIFIFGYFLAKYKDNILKYTNIFTIMSFIAFPILFTQWNYNKPLFIKYIIISNPRILSFITDFYQYALGVTGSIIIYSIIKLIKNKYFKEVLSYIGTISLEMYVLQMICLNVAFGSGTFRTIMTFTLATSISIILCLIINRVSILGIILFGRGQKKIEKLNLN